MHKPIEIHGLLVNTLERFVLQLFLAPRRHSKNLAMGLLKIRKPKVLRVLELNHVEGVHDKGDIDWY